MIKFTTIAILFSCLTISFAPTLSFASMDLLSLPAKQSHLATKSVTMSLSQYDNSLFATGERGHIINWQSADSWQQESVPVSLSITDLTRLADGTRIAVGHDSVILKSAPNSTVWVKVFDGYQLSELKVVSIKQRMAELEQMIANETDEELQEELSITLEDLSFALEDTEAEVLQGPSKPLLAVTATQSGKVYAVGAYGTLLGSDDQGETWQLLDRALDNPDSFHLNTIVTSSTNQLYIAGESGLGFTSTDEGATWQSIELPYGGSIFGLATSQNTVVAFGLQGNFMVSNDAGNHWQAANLGASASILGGTIDGTTAYLVGHGGIVVKFDINNISQFKVSKHPSGAAFSAVVVQQQDLVLAGQFGMTSWPKP